ncbi:MAG: energy-dependent translational throttle protein EttA [Pseudomonadota bacterium]
MSKTQEPEKIIFSMIGVSRMHPPQKKVLKDINLSFFYGAKIGILGLNGSGKSSLLRIIAGEDKEFTGDVSFSKEYSIGFLHQEPHLDDSKTVLECVQEGVKETIDLLKEFELINASFENEMSADEMDTLIEKQAKVQEMIDHKDAWELDHRLEIAMDALRCPPADRIVATLSGGERRRVALCRLLIEEPDILLLDEPTNHLDAESVFWLERYLQKYAGTVIAVTHDRYFLDNVAGWILELDRGEGIPYKGNYSSWLEQKERRLNIEAKQDDKRKKTLARELEWVRQSPSARRAKNKARIAQYHNLLAQDREQLEKDLEIVIPEAPRLGQKVIEAANISKAFGDKLLYENLNFRLPQGGIVGIIGPNGAGKTTLFKMILKQEKPDSGDFAIGDTVSISYVAQDRFPKDDKRTIWEVISEGNDIIKIGNREVNSRAYVARFNFSGGDQQKPVDTLSGGERNRVHLANALKNPGNVLLLDEPTNDLDVNTIRSLEEALLTFTGCAVIISHDRWFLDRVATHILSFEGNSQAYWFEGGFSDYESDKVKRLGKSANQPHRIQYKKIN